VNCGQGKCGQGKESVEMWKCGIGAAFVGKHYVGLIRWTISQSASTCTAFREVGRKPFAVFFVCAACSHIVHMHDVAVKVMYVVVMFISVRKCLFREVVHVNNFF